VDESVAEGEALSGNEAAVAMGGVDGAGAAQPTANDKSKASERILG